MNRAATIIVFNLLIAFSGSVRASDVEAELLVAGATESGWAAAIQAARMGVKKIVIVHDGKWYGGQFTEQALACVDENKGVGKVGWGPEWHPMKRSFHRSGLFKELMDRIESFNREKYGSTMPGNPWHGPSTFRPAEAEKAFRSLIQPYRESGQIEVFWNKYPVSADVDRTGTHPRLTRIGFAPVGEKEADLFVSAKITIDATDWGEVIQVSGAEYECGPDPRSRYAEPSAPENPDEFPHNEMNPITWAMIVEDAKTEVPIEEPPHFDDRNYPRATKFSQKEFASLEWDRPARRGSILHWPDAGKESPRQLSVYTVRRIVDGTTSPDKTTSILLNYMNGQDYPLVRLPGWVSEALEELEPGASRKNIVDMTREERDVIFQDAKNHSLGVLYHLQNFVHEHATDRANSFRHFQLSNEFGTEDRLPPKPYIRESLRLKAMYMMREQDGRNRDGETKTLARERFSHVMYPDGLFAWQFHYDFHRTGRTFLKEEGENGPWIDYEKPGRHTRYVSDRSVFPARSLVPEEMDGLLGAQKNLGYSSVVSAAIRLHDQCIHVGQASGAMAAVALRAKVDAREIPYRRRLLEEVRHGLCGGNWGRPLLIWPWRDLPSSSDAFVAINRLSALGCLPIEPRVVDFDPDGKASADFVEEVLTLSSKVFPGLSGWESLREGELSRGDFCRRVWTFVESEKGESVSFLERSEDTDGDGIPDVDDALLFTPNEPIVWAIEKPILTEHTDGLIDHEKGGLERWVQFGSAIAEGFEWDQGQIYDKSRGFGWGRDISRNERKRGVFPEVERDSFLFTREQDVWTCDVEAGATYELTICVGDAGHLQEGHYVSVEEIPVFAGEATEAGSFLERTVTVTPAEGQIRMVAGRPDSSTNTTVCWLVLRRVP